MAKRKSKIQKRDEALIKLGKHAARLLNERKRKTSKKKEHMFADYPRLRKEFDNKKKSSKKKVYTKIHKELSAAHDHAKKIRKRGGSVKESCLPGKKGVKLEYHF